MGEEFGLGAGPRSDEIGELNGGVHLEGTITGEDMLPIGSATKGFNCAAIYRLADQGKIKLDDFAYIYID